jgi:methyl-accepting chemotaxis protein
MGSIAFRSVRTKILAAFLVAGLGIVAASGVTLLKLRDTYQLVEQAKVRQLAPTRHASTMALNLKSFTIAEMFLIQMLREPGGMPKAEQARDNASGMLEVARVNAGALGADALPASVRPAADKFIRDYHTYEALISPVLTMPLEVLRQVTQHTSGDDSSIKAFMVVDSSGAALLDELNKAAAADQTKAKNLYHSSARATAGVLAGCLLLSIVLGLVVAQTIRRPLKKTVRVLEGVADGDLTRRLDVHSSDEVGQMAVTLNQTLSTVHDVIEQIELSANKLTELAEAGTSGVGSTTETSAELADMANNLNAMIGIFQTESSKG